MANNLRGDPTRTTGIRRQALAAVDARFAAVTSAVWNLVVREDVFGLVAKPINPLTNEKHAFRFLTDEKKVDAFNKWLDEQVKAKILGVVYSKDPGKAGEVEYVTSAYKQGVQRGFQDANPEAMAQNVDFYNGTKGQFLKDSFGAPETLSKLKLLATRNYNSLKGYTEDMKGKMGSVLVSGLAAGKGPQAIAKDLVQATGMAKAKAKTLARTEIINAHAEGQLDAFEKLGVTHVGVMAEWATAGDGKVCPLCSNLEGVVLTIKEARGLIPRHPNCRCAWLPAAVGEKATGQKWSKEVKQWHIKESMIQETGATSLADAKAASTWAGKDLKMSETPKPKVPAEGAASAALASAKEKADLEKEKAAADAKAKALQAEIAAKAAEKAKADAEAAAKKAEAQAASAAAAQAKSAGLKTTPKDYGITQDDKFKNKLHDVGIDKVLQAHKLSIDVLPDAVYVKVTDAKTVQEQINLLKAWADEKNGVTKPAAPTEHISVKDIASYEAVEKVLKKHGSSMMDIPSDLEELLYASSEGKKPAAEAAAALNKYLDSLGAAKPRPAPAPPKAKPAPEPPKAKPAPAGATPASMADVNVIKSLPGSTKPKLVEDTTTGAKWVMKEGLDPGHVRSEALADKLYRVAGAPVPKSGILETTGGPVKFSEYLDKGQTLEQWKNGKTKEQVAAMYGQIQKHFVLDALFANHDVAGLSHDNIFIVGYTAYRIDNGGALTYRAQGSAKAGWGPVVAELTSMRDPKVNTQTAEIFKGLTEKEIQRQIKDIVAKKEDILGAVDDTKLRATLAARIDYLAGTLPAEKPATAAKPGAVAGAKANPRAPEYGVDVGTAERVIRSRINGTTIAADKKDVEDNNILAWGEKDTSGKDVTKVWLKVTGEGSEKVTAALGDALKTAAVTAPNIPASNQHPIDFTNNYAGKAVSMAKTLAAHQADGKYNESTVKAAKAAASALDKWKPVDEEGHKMKAHYQDIFKKLNEAYDAKTTVAKDLVKPYVYTPPVAKATAAPQASPFKVNAQSTFTAPIKEIKNGHAKAQNIENRFSATVYKIEAGDGVSAKFVQRDMNPHGSNVAFQGWLEVQVPGAPSAETLQKAMGTLGSLGVDTAPPSKAYEEALYLHRTIYQNKKHTDPAYASIWGDKSLTDEQRVTHIKEWVKREMKVDVDKLPPGTYDPTGLSKTGFGDGLRYWKRWDITEEEMAKKMAGHKVVHTSGGLQSGQWESTKRTLEGVLQSGGEFTSTLDRIRKGVDVGATGGASSSADLGTGGGSYFFTRIKKEDNLPKISFVFKNTTLMRQDAISYNGDKFGRVSAIDTRASTPTEYKKFAANASNETIFKAGLSIDDLDTIRVQTAAQKAELVKIFKDNKLEKLPDGRKPEDIIEVSK